MAIGAVIKTNPSSLMPDTFSPDTSSGAPAQRQDTAPVAHFDNLKIINLLGSPGQGKSTVRSGLFWLMKTYGMSVEEVSEYAKYLVLSGRTWQLSSDQMYVFAKQHHKQLVLKGQYEYAVTDSPLMLCDFYAPKAYFNSFSGLVRDTFESFENVNFFLSRDLNESEFQGVGRLHDREASKIVELEMREFLDKHNIAYVDVKIDIHTPWRILEILAPGMCKMPKF